MPNNGSKKSSPGASDVGRQLDERLMELQALNEMSQILNSSLKMKTILDNALLTPMGKMMISKGMVLLFEEEDTLKVEIVKGMPRELIDKTITIDGPLFSAPTLVDEVDEKECQWVRFFKEFGIVLLLPLFSSNRSTGMICFGAKLTGDYTAAELEFLGSLSNIAATAIENGLIFRELNQVNRELDKKIQELNTLFDIGKELNSSLDKGRILNLLSYAIMGELVVNRCLLFLREGELLRLETEKGGKSTGTQIDCIDDVPFLKELCCLEEPVVIEETKDAHMRDYFKSLGVDVIAPMRLKEKTLGLVAVGPKITKIPFGSHDLEFLRALGNYAMISIENARLFEEALEKQRMEEELAIAKEIQKGLLPDMNPKIAGYELAGTNHSSREVGGDYFDWIAIDESRYGIAIADVSGKGTPAALLMANVQAMLHALVSTGGGVGDMVGKINNLIHANTDYSKFITFFYGELDITRHTFTFSNAGHNPPFILHENGEIEILIEGGLILGMMPEVSYEERTIQLRKGDYILMYTDGVTEAMDEDENEFGEERVEKILSEYNALSAEAIIKKVTAEVEAFVRNTPQSDDITLVALKVTG